MYNTGLLGFVKGSGLMILEDGIACHPGVCYSRIARRFTANYKGFDCMMSRLLSNYHLPVPIPFRIYHAIIKAARRACILITPPGADHKKG